MKLTYCVLICCLAVVLARSGGGSTGQSRGSGRGGRGIARSNNGHTASRVNSRAQSKPLISVAPVMAPKSNPLSNPKAHVKPALNLAKPKDVDKNHKAPSKPIPKSLDLNLSPKMKDTPKTKIMGSISGSTRQGADLNIEVQRNLWQSQNKRQSIDAYGGMSQHFGGPNGKSKPDVHGGLQYELNL